MFDIASSSHRNSVVLSGRRTSHLRQVHDNEQNYQEMSTILSGRRLITEEYPTTLALVLHSLCSFPLTQLHFLLLAFARVCTCTWT